MCGIVGIIGKQDVAPVILEALKRLEYRGYDSAGIATVADNRLARRRSEGKLVNLQNILESQPLAGAIGIGHTRWATHGAPTEQNAHPHATSKVAVVHNGIIENFVELKKQLQAEGAKFDTDTDTEVIVHHFTSGLEKGLSHEEAAQQTFNALQGAFAIGLVIDGVEDKMIAARKGSPLVIGHGDGEMFIGSDAFSLGALTNRITYLEDGDWAVITRDGVDVFAANGKSVTREMQIVDAASALVDKGQHRHFMAKEIFEQPEVLSHTFAHYIDAASEKVTIPELDFSFEDFDRITLIACGTAYYAAMIGKTWLEQLAGMPAEIDIASEFRYRNAPLDKKTLAIFVSQSGETADTLAALRHCKQAGLKTLVIVNAPESSMQRDADVTLPTFAGPEIGVASTKAFTCQLTVLLCLSLYLANARKTLTAGQEQEIVRDILTLPRLAGDVFKLDDQIVELAGQVSKAENALYIGRGAMFPLALEGALKLKEISYIHAEGFAAGELKHGSIALVEENLPVIALAPKDALYPKTVSNMQEVIARQGRVIVITDDNSTGDDSMEGVDRFVLPSCHPSVMPILYALPLQLLAYHTAVAKGTDVDQPRNLAKSVTVE